MVFLQRRPPPPPPPPPSHPPTSATARPSQDPNQISVESSMALLADAGCTLLTPAGPPSLPPDLSRLRRRLATRFEDSSLVSSFIAGFSAYVHSPDNFRRALTAECGSESLVRTLLLVGPVQLPLLRLLLEKLPEYFHVAGDVCGWILNHLRWLDFLVDAKGLSEKLLEVLSICPIEMKKEIIGSLPEIFGDWHDERLVSALEKMLQEDSDLVVPVLDSFSNLNLNAQLQEQVVTIALSCIQTIDTEHMPFLLRFLMLSAHAGNARRIVLQIRQNITFFCIQEDCAAVHRKGKGKSVAHGNEAFLEALSSSLRFTNMLCDVVLKEIKSLDNPQDHKVIDLWLLLLIYSNGSSWKKSVEVIIKKKVMDGCFTEELLHKCIHWQKLLAKDYLLSFLAICQYLFECKDQRARDFGIFMYMLLFKEFADTYSRQEILGAIVMHIGSGVSYEVDSAVDAMILLTSECSKELLPLCTCINGVLDYLEGFSDKNLHKVYEVFTILARCACLTANTMSSSIVNELLMILRKQVSNLDLKYKKMGIIGILKLVSVFGDVSTNMLSPSQSTIVNEALELLKLSLDSYKYQPLPLILLYDETVSLLERATLQPAILEWMSKQVGEFESKFLFDLDEGQLAVKDTYKGLEGALWMNLDGVRAPICLNILPLLCSSEQQSSLSLQTLPANFLLLSTVERLSNEGSLGGIDALLGCPLHLPSSKYFASPTWKVLTGRQKEIVCLSLYYAVNWMRELLNAFCTQVSGAVQCITQATKKETIDKLLKRLRNLVYLESLLNTYLKRCQICLPELHSYMECSKLSSLSNSCYLEHGEKKRKLKKASGKISSGKKRKCEGNLTQESSGHMYQPTILEVLQKAGASATADTLSKGQSGLPSKDKTSQSCKNEGSNIGECLENSASAKVLDAQRFKFRPLHINCLILLSFTESQDACCSDPAAEFPQYLYLLRDFNCKLDHFIPSSKQHPFSTTLMTYKTSPGLVRTSASEVLSQIRTLSPSLKKHLDTAMSFPKEVPKSCGEHGGIRSPCPGNQDTQDSMVLRSSDAEAICIEILCCFCKMLSLPDLYVPRNLSALVDLLGAFQPIRIAGDILSGIQPFPSPGSVTYLFCGAYSYLEDLLSMANSCSFLLAYEVLVTLESLVNSVPFLLEKLAADGKSAQPCFASKSVQPFLQNKIGRCAHKLLLNEWEFTNQDDWKTRKDMTQRLLQIYIRNNDCPSELLAELALSILPQVSSCKLGATQEAAVHGFSTLRPTTFLVWYQVLHQENLSILRNLVKEFGVSKSRYENQPETIKRKLMKLRQSVDIVVALVNICRSHDKVTLYAVAVKYGGKFVDSFLKVFDFLQAHFNEHNESIIQVVKELQKATRTIQTLCSEAKGSKQTLITSKIPATKRSMERFIFHVKALLHTVYDRSTFWMGNLKHKDLYGQVVSSQVYVNGDDIDTQNQEDDAEEGGGFNN